jgi:hypothetical protein
MMLGGKHVEIVKLGITRLFQEIKQLFKNNLSLSGVNELFSVLVISLTYSETDFGDGA